MSAKTDSPVPTAYVTRVSSTESVLDVASVSGTAASTLVGLHTCSSRCGYGGAHR